MSEDWVCIAPESVNQRHKFLGEDDEDVKDNWDDEEEAEEESIEADNPETDDSVKKKSLSKRISAKEEAKKKEEEKRTKKSSEDRAKKTPEERLADKLREQRLQEESDLMLVKEAFGVYDEAVLNGDLETKEDFDNFRKNLLIKLQAVSKSTYFFNFIEQTVREICVSLAPGDIKKLSSSLNALYNEKLKATRQTKPKKKGGKSTLKLERTALEYNGQFDNDDYDEEEGDYDLFG